MKKYILITFLVFSFQVSLAQLHPHLNFPRSTASFGMGGQSVSLNDPISAMVGNPANLVYENGVTFSLYRDPFYFFDFFRFPFFNLTLTANYSDKHYFGLEYNYWDLGHWTIKEGEEKGRYFEKAFSLAYTKEFNDNFAIGSKLTYGQTGEWLKSNAFLLSLGFAYSTTVLNRNANFGIAFLNFGDRIKIKRKYENNEYNFVENPSQLKLGMYYDLFNLPLIKSNIALEFFKELISHTNGNVDNSFKALINDWKDFPEDVVSTFGISLNSFDIFLGKGFGFNNNYYLGYVTWKWGGEFLTFGTSLGINYKDFSFGLGLSGMWFTQRNLISGNYIGYETFNFILHKKFNWSNEKLTSTTSQIVNPEKYLISFGTSYAVPTGLFKTNQTDSKKYSNRPVFRYELDFEFLFNNKFSYLASINYLRTKEQVDFIFGPFLTSIEYGSELFSILMGLGFYPFDNFFNGFYLHSKVGVLRYNPIPGNIYPKYSYYPIVNLSSGYKFNLFETNFYLIPNLGFSTFFAEKVDNIFYSSDILYGLKFFNVGLKLGYRI